MTKQEQLYKNNAKPEKAKRLKKCHYCGERKVPYGDMRTFCLTNECIMAHNVKQKEKEKRKAVQKFKETDKSELMKKAQFYFNKYIRLRDRNLPCISCGHNGNRQRHASHFRPVGRNSKHRFNEMNVHSACSICNAHLSGNLIPYRKAMIKLYGIDSVEMLESDNRPYQYSIDELKDIIDTYMKKAKEIRGEVQN